MNMITNNIELKRKIVEVEEYSDLISGITVNFSTVDSTELDQIITIEYCDDKEAHDYANKVYTKYTTILCNTSTEAIRDYQVTFSRFDDDTKWIKLSFKLNQRD